MGLHIVRIWLMQVVVIVVLAAGCSPATDLGRVSAPTQPAAPPTAAPPVAAPTATPPATPAAAGLAQQPSIARVDATAAPTPNLNSPSGGAGEPLAQRSLFRRRDVPPGGFETTIVFGGMGPGDTDSCEFVLPAEREPHPGFAECVAEVNQAMTVSFIGFAPRQEVVFEARAADKLLRTEKGTVDEQGVATWNWTSLPIDPLGSTTLVATQGSVRSSASLDVQPSSHARAVVLPKNGAAGTAFQLYLAGLPPGQQLQVGLYRARSLDEYEYIAALGSATIDERGNAVFAVPTRPDDPWNDYVVATNVASLSARSGRFSITAQDPLSTSALKIATAALTLPFQENSPACLGATITPGATGFRFGAMEIGAAVVLCGRGFVPYQRVRIEARDPSRSAVWNLGDTYADGSGSVRTPPTFATGMAPGTYQLTFSKGYGSQTQASATVELRASSHPRLLSSTDPIRPGGTLGFTLVGFDAHDLVQVSVYRRSRAEACQPLAECWSYVGSFPPTAVSSTGIMSHDVSLGASAPAGEYRLLTNPPSSDDVAGFSVFDPTTSVFARSTPPPAGMPPILPPQTSVPACLPQRLAVGAAQPASLGILEIGQVVPPACLQGFKPDEDLDVSIQGPNRYSRRYSSHADATGVAQVIIFADPDSPPGVYAIYVNQSGAYLLMGQYTVRPTRTPRVAIPYRTIASGAGRDIIFAGFAPNTPVSVHLYKQVGGAPCPGGGECFVYRTALPEVHVDDAGKGRFGIQAEPTDAEGTYAVLAAPGNGVAYFDVVSPTPPALRTAETVRSALTKFVSETITNANKRWAEAVGRNGDLETLKWVYGGPWLEQVSSSAEKMRALGQYRIARMVSPVIVKKASQVNNRRVEADVVEEWDDVLFAADGSIARRFPGHVEQHYVLGGDGPAWQIVESTLARSN